jgi:hypothetical protein
MRTDNEIMHPGLAGPLPPGHISGPSAWYGKDLAQNDDWIMRLSSDDLDDIHDAIHAFAATGLPMQAISRENFPLPRLEGKVKAIEHDLLDGRGFILIRGFNVHDYTPEQSAIAYLGLGSHLGAPRSQNARGHLLGHVKDVGLDISDPNVRYYQTNKRLEYHTDSVDIVGLLCLQPAKSGGESFIVSSVTCYNEMIKRWPDLAPLLFEPFPTDRRGEVPPGMAPWFDIPVFNWYAGKLSTIYARQYIVSAQENFPEARRLTPSHWKALECFTALTNDPAIHLQMAFEAGDIQLLHNHQILHSRNDFENWPEPQRQRHLLRLWLCPPHGRPLPEYFAPRYGDVTPGDRGGIVVAGARLQVSLDP